MSVQHLAVHNISAQSMLLTWQPVSGATGYRLSWVTLTGRCLSQSFLPFCWWPQGGGTGGGTAALALAGQDRHRVDLDAGRTSHALGGLQPNTDYVVTVAPLFGQLEGPTATVRQRTGRCHPATGLWLYPQCHWHRMG